MIERALYFSETYAVSCLYATVTNNFFQYGDCPSSLASLCLDIRNTRQLESPLAQNGLMQGSVAYNVIRLAVAFGLVRAEVASIWPVLDLLVLKTK
jgi:hypothetical protein